MLAMPRLWQGLHLLPSSGCNSSPQQTLAIVHLLGVVGVQEQGAGPVLHCLRLAGRRRQQQPAPPAGAPPRCARPAAVLERCTSLLMTWEPHTRTEHPINMPIQQLHMFHTGCQALGQNFSHPRRCRPQTTGQSTGRTARQSPTRRRRRAPRAAGTAWTRPRCGCRLGRPAAGGAGRGPPAPAATRRPPAAALTPPAPGLPAAHGVLG